MSTTLWRGDALAVAQVNTWTFSGTWLTNETVTLTINGKALVTVTGSSTIATLITTVANALIASKITEFLEITFGSTSTTITGTAKTAGIPFTATLSTNSASGTINGGSSSTGTATVVSSGPKDWSTAANWSGGAVPTTEDVVFNNSANDCIYGLDQHTVTLASLTIDQNYTGKIGNARYNPAGYLEYRPLYLQVGATLLTIGNGPGAGSGRLKIDTYTIQTAVNVFNSGSPTESNIKSILWKGTHASNTVNISKGSFAAAYLEGETATIVTLSEGFQTSQAGDADVYLGAGCTLTTITKTGGSLYINSNVTTLTQGPGNAGTTTIAAGTPTTVTITGGTVVYRTAGTCTTLTVGQRGSIDFSQDPRAKTITNTTIYAGATLSDPGKSLTFTNPVALKCALADITIDLGVTFNLQRS